MKSNALVFKENEAPIKNIIDHAIKNKPHLRASEVRVIRAAQAAAGAVWSPQQPAYVAWAAREGSLAVAA